MLAPESVLAWIVIGAIAGSGVCSSRVTGSASSVTSSSAFWALLNFLAVVQFVWLLIAREPNQFIAGFGISLAIWLAEVARFLTFATDEKPFPWRTWSGTSGLPVR